MTTKLWGKAHTHRVWSATGVRQGSQAGALQARIVRAKRSRVRSSSTNRFHCLLPLPSRPVRPSRRGVGEREPACGPNKDGSTLICSASKEVGPNCRSRSLQLLFLVARFLRLSCAFTDTGISQGGSVCVRVRALYHMAVQGASHAAPHRGVCQSCTLLAWKCSKTLNQIKTIAYID